MGGFLSDEKPTQASSLFSKTPTPRATTAMALPAGCVRAAQSQRLHIAALSKLLSGADAHARRPTPQRLSFDHADARRLPAVDRPGPDLWLRRHPGAAATGPGPARRRRRPYGRGVSGGDGPDSDADGRPPASHASGENHL